MQNTQTALREKLRAVISNTLESLGKKRKATVYVPAVVSIVALASAYNILPNLDFNVEPTVIYKEIDPVENLSEDDHKQISCLAENMYFEARNQSDDGVRAVGFVTFNRLRSVEFPKTLCDVVYEVDPDNKRKCQFSWYCDGKKDVIADTKAWGRVYSIALNMYLYYNKMSDNTQGATYYHTIDSKPRWRKHYQQVTVIEDHIFYKDN